MNSYSYFMILPPQTLTGIVIRVLRSVTSSTTKSYYLSTNVSPTNNQSLEKGKMLNYTNTNGCI